MDGSIFSLRSTHVLTLAVLGLLCVGVLTVQSASMSVGGSSSFAFTGRALWHAIYAAVAFLTFLAVSRIDYRRFAAPKSLMTSPFAWAMLIAIALSMAVLVIGVEVNGARRWIRLGPVQLQPSEVAKWTTAIFLAWWFAARPVPLEKFFKGFCITGIPIVIVCLLTVKEDLGTAALIAFVALLMMLIGGVRWWHLCVVIPPVLAAGAYFLMHKAYRLKRMTSFLDPWADARGEGYHMVQSLLSFASGGVAGKGLGGGVQKLGYLPEDTTDFVFSVVCEELGFFGAMIVVTLYLAILMVAVRAIRRANIDPFGKLLAFGIAATIGLQACINIAVATVSMPTKGMSLPLVSAGGTGLIITCASLGLLASVVRAGVKGNACAYAPDDKPIDLSSFQTTSAVR
jgi:cell division protein FtsW